MARWRLLALLLPFSLANAVAAQPVVITGSITDSKDKPVTGARAALFAYESPYVEARALVEGKEPPVIAQTPADATGRFRIAVPDVGFYRLEVSAPGFLAVQRELAPLVSDLDLEPARLEAATDIVVRVQSSAGSPRENAWVTTKETGRRDAWRPARRLARTNADGTVRLPRGEKETPSWLAAAPGFAEVGGAARASITLRLEADALRKLRIIDAQGRPAREVIAVGGEGSSPFAITNDAGGLEVPGRWEKLELLLPSGPATKRRLTPVAAASPPLTIQLSATGSVEGRVIDVMTRRPIEGALVWTSRRPETLVRTRGDGRYQMDGLEAGMANLRTAAPGYAAGFGNVATVSAGAAAHGPTLALMPSRALGGVVVDAQGRGIAGASVSARFDMQRVDRDVMALGLGAGRVRATAGGDGRFVLPALAAGQPYALTTRAEGYGPVHSTVRAPADRAGDADLRIVLARGLVASGLAVDGKRRPVAGATATLRPNAGQRELAAFRDDAEPVEATSDGAGRFTFEDLAPGRYDLEVQAAALAPVDVPGIEIKGESRAELGTVILLAEGIVEGTVVNPSGQPIAEVSIAIEDQNGSERGRSPFQGEEEETDTKTSGDGWFRVGGLRPQHPVRVNAWAKGYGPQEAVGVVPSHAPAPSTRIVLQPASRLAGRVVDRAQKPIAGAAVSGMLERPSMESMWRTRIGDDPLVTDGDGRFELREVAEGMAQIQVRADGFQNGTLQVPVSAGKDVLDLELVLQPGAVVAGRVLDAAGDPVITASVGIGENHRRLGGTRVDADGVYRLSGIPTGRTTITASEGARKASTEIEVSSGENTVDLVFDAGSSVSGTVINAEGMPVADARVFLRGANAVAAFSNNAVTGADGRFQLKDQRDGAYQLTAMKSGMASREVAVTVAGAPVAGLEIRLERGAALVGQLEGLDFAELPRARVYAAVGNGPGSAQGYADFAGRFRLEGLSAGEWDVEANIDGDNRRARAHVTVAPGDDEVPVVLRFQPGLRLTGAVTRREQPVSGAEIFLSGQGVAAGGSAVTDPNGRFRIEGLERGSYAIEVATLGQSVYRDVLEIEEDRELQIELRSGALRGRVVSATTREPIARVEVRVWRPDVDPSDMVGDGQVRTDSRGLFFFEQIAAGDWRLRAGGEGFASEERDVDIAADADVEIEVALQPTEGLILDLNVEGQPLGSGFALVVDAAGRVVFDGYFTTDEKGRTRFASVPPGPVTVWVVSTETAPAKVTAVVPGPPVAIGLRRGGHLDVRIPDLYGDSTTVKVAFVDAAGQQLEVPNGRALEREFELFAGHRELRHLSPGRWTVTARAADGRVWTGSTVIPPGGGESEIVLQRE